MYRLLSEAEAMRVICPFTIPSGERRFCLGSSCFSWINIENPKEKEGPISSSNVGTCIKLIRKKD